MWSIVVTVSSLVLGVAHAQVFGTGSCPKITTQKDFELNKVSTYFVFISHLCHVDFPR